MLTEDEVVDRTCRALERRGFEIVTRATSREHGYDIVASRGPLTLIIEAKGAGSSRPGSNRHGLEFNSGQVFDHVAKAVLKALRVTASGDARAGVALARQPSPPQGDLPRPTGPETHRHPRRLGVDRHGDLRARGLLRSPLILVLDGPGTLDQRRPHVRPGPGDLAEGPLGRARAAGQELRRDRPESWLLESWYGAPDRHHGPQRAGGRGRRGVSRGNSSTFDIDHMVPLAEAWDSDAYKWSQARRDRYSNDRVHAGP